MPKQGRVRQPSLTAQVGGCLLDVGRVPVDDGGDDEVQRHDAFLLGLVRPVVDAALGMREHGPGEGMSRLALVEPRLALHAELGAFHPVEHEQRAFDAPDLAEREI